VTIHNQCSNTELVAPIYFGDGAVCHNLSNRQIDINAKMNVSLEINAIQDDFEGALLFRLQKYSGKEYNMDTLAIETDKSEADHVYMLVAWKVKDAKPFVYVVLVGHTNEFTWNENELKKLYEKNQNRLREYYDAISDTWFMDNNMTLRTTFRVKDLKVGFELNIFISEEERDDYAIRPLCVDLER
jgi:hypothetical protein